MLWGMLHRERSIGWVCAACRLSCGLFGGPVARGMQWAWCEAFVLRGAGGQKVSATLRRVVARRG